MAIKNIPNLAPAAALADTDLVPITQGTDVPVKADLTTIASFVLAPNEGTFTPTVAFATPGDLAVSYSTQHGEYVRRGNHVWIAIRVAFTLTYTTASGMFSIGGLPFTARADADNPNYGLFAPRFDYLDFLTGDNQIGAAVAAGTSIIRLWRMRDALGSAACGTGSLPSSSNVYDIHISGEYPV